MSLINILLPGTLISELFKGNLVEIPEKEKQKAASATTTHSMVLQYMGKNLNQTLVYVNYPREIFLPDKQMAFLGKMLRACNLNIEEIALINMAAQEENHRYFLANLQPKLVFVFGAKDLVFPEKDDIDFFVPLNINGTTVITSPSLDILSKQDPESKKLKSLFWASLKQLFNLP